MKSKHKKYIKKHLHQENLEEIAQKLGIGIAEVREYANKCLSSYSDKADNKDTGPSKWLKTISFVFSFIIFPFIIFLLAFNKNSLNGLIDAVECGQYLSCVNGVFQGKLPFKDFIPLAAGPLLIWVLSATFFIFGKTLYVLRMYFNFFSILTYIFLYFFACNLYRFKFSAYILSIVALVETFNPFWSSRWAGYSRFGVGLLGLFFQILYVKKSKPLYLFISGFIASLGLLYSVDSGIVLIISGAILCFLAVLYDPKGNFLVNIKEVFKRLSVFCLGLVIGLLPFAIYMAINKALVPYLEGMFIIASKHVSVWQKPIDLSFIGAFRQHHNNPWQFFISDEFKFYMPRLFYFVTLIYIILKFKRGKDVIDCIAVPLIAIFGVLTYKSGCRAFLGPQFDVSVLPLLLLFVYFMEKSIILIFSKAKIRLLAKAISILVVLVLFLYMGASHKRVYGSWGNWLKYQSNKNNLIPHYITLIDKSIIQLVRSDTERIGPILIPKDQVEEIDGVAKYMINNTLPGEPVFAFPEHSLYNFLTDRPAVSRFYITVYAHTTDKWKDELLTELQLHPPRYIIYSRQLSNLAKISNRKTELLPEVISLILDNYVIEKNFSNIAIYRRKS